MNRFEFSKCEWDPSTKDTVCRLRRECYGREAAGEEEPIDAYSSHIVAKVNGDLVAALRLTYQKDGVLESQEFIPDWVLYDYGDQLSSVSRLCVIDNLRGTRLSIELLRQAWRNAIQDGIRLNISQARLDTIPFYLRLGMFYIKRSLFDFERWQVRCGFVVSIADPLVESRFQDLFVGMANPCKLLSSQHADQLTRKQSEVRDEITLTAD